MKKILGAAIAIPTFLAVTIAAAPAGAYSWWVNTPPKEPVYDANVRAKPDRLFATVGWSLVAAWLILNGLDLGGVI